MTVTKCQASKLTFGRTVHYLMFELSMLKDTLRAEEFLVIFAEKFNFLSWMCATVADTCFYISLTGVIWA